LTTELIELRFDAENREDFNLSGVLKHDCCIASVLDIASWLKKSMDSPKSRDKLCEDRDTILLSDIFVRICTFSWSMIDCRGEDGDSFPGDLTR